MSFEIIFAACLVAVTLGLLLLRTKCNFVVLALCAGYVLAATLQDVLFESVNDLSFQLAGISNSQLLMLVITILPGIIVAWHFHRSTKGLGFLQQLAPAVGVTGLLVVLVRPILEQTGLNAQLDDSPLWGLFTTYERYIIIYAIVVSLLGIMIEADKPHKRGLLRKKKD